MILSGQLADTKAYVDWFVKHGDDEAVQEWRNQHAGSSYVDAYIALIKHAGPTIQKTLIFDEDDEDEVEGL